MAYGVTPDLVVGDFDSPGVRPRPPNVTQLPRMKDDTDMVFALRQGLKLGYRRFVLLGGVGGRLGAHPGQLQILDWLTPQGAVGFLAGEKTAATALRGGSLTFPSSMTGYPLRLLQQRHRPGGDPYRSEIPSPLAAPWRAVSL